jgi:ATP-dependent RNA helicase SUPV3L1/SUV3
MTQPGRQANLEAIARRLGVRQKSLLGIFKKHDLQPLEQDIYDLDRVVSTLAALPTAELEALRALQKATPDLSRLYRDKFEVLTPFMPQAPMATPTVHVELADHLPELLSHLDIAKTLRISIRRAKELTQLGRLEPRRDRQGNQKLWSTNRLRALLVEPRVERELARWRQEFEADNARRDRPHAKPEKTSRPQLLPQQQAARTSIAERVQVDIRAREVAPESAHLYVGPTNSGKTYTALNNLFESYEQARTDAVFVYAGPLRMLAFEVYQKMVERYGEEQVGFLTGEEQINPGARLIACTVEMAPKGGHSLVLDETHWIADHSRGQHWTNLLLGSSYRHYHILTAAEALPMVSQLIEDAEEITTETFERKTPLVFAGPLKVNAVPARSAVICFSRKSVYATANLLEKAGKRVGVLYGALPLPVRKRQIDRYLAGQYDIMVTTDVIGHGINLPIDNVIFAQSEKFDGIEHRALRTWEIAQIAGRAGRFGLSREGKVYHLTGRAWFTRDAALLQEGTLAGAGQVPTDLQIREAVITPQLRDLNIVEPAEILPALEAWQLKARALLKDRSIAPSNLADKIAILQAIAEPRDLPLAPSRRAAAWPVSLHEVWQLISGPYNPEGRTLQQVFTWLADRERATSDLLDRHLRELMRPLQARVHASGNQNGDQVAILEASVQGVGELKMATIMFGQLGSLYRAELFEAEDRLNEAITNTLHELIKAGSYGVCKRCGAPTTPWFVYCEDCFHQQSLAYAR